MMSLFSEMLRTLTSVMVCSVCKVICSEEPFYLCGHVVCKDCNKGHECSACELGADGNTTSSSIKYVKDLFEQLVASSLEEKTGIGVIESEELGITDCRDHYKSQQCISDEILSIKKEEKDVEINLTNLIEDASITSVVHNGHCYEPDSHQPSYSLDSKTQLENSIVLERVSNKVSENCMEEKNNLNDNGHCERRIKRHLKHSRKKKLHSDKKKPHLCEGCADTIFEKCNGLIENTNSKKNKNINGLQESFRTNIKIGAADVLELLERYKKREESDLNEGNSYNIDDSAFIDMPKLERQDIYDPKIDLTLDFLEVERDMCPLEREIYLEEPDETSESSSQVVKNTGANVVVVEVDDSHFSDESILPTQHDASPSLPCEKNDNFEKQISQGTPNKNRIMNVTLLRTSNNSYIVKKNSDDDCEPVNTNNFEEQQSSSCTGGSDQETNVFSDATSISEKHKTIKRKYSDFEASRKVRRFLKKRKKRIHQKNHFRSHSNLGIISYDTGTEYVNDIHSSEVGESPETGVNQDSDDSAFHSGSLCIHNSAKRLKMSDHSEESYNDNVFIGNLDDQQPCQLPPEEKKSVCDKSSFNNFIGFSEADILSISLKAMLFQMNNSSSLSLSFTFGEKEVTVKKKKNVLASCRNQMETPSVNTPTMQIVSPVNTLEKANANATICFEKSVVDVVDLLSSTPGPDIMGPSRSRRQLLFESPLFEKVHELSAIEELSLGDLESSLEHSHSELKMKSDETEEIKRSLLRDSSTQTSPISSRRVSLSGTNQMLSSLPSRNFALEDQFDGSIATSNFSKTVDQAGKLTFTTCCLTNSESQLVMRLARMTKSSLSKDFTHETTHLIVGKGAHECSEYLLAIAYRAYIVTVDWVNLCLREEAILSPIDFILETEDGPRRCIEPSPPPFEGFYIFFKICSSISDYSLYELTKTLCSLGGAKVVLDHEKFNSFVQEKAYPRFLIFENILQLTPEVIDKCKKLQMVPLKNTWVNASISAFKAKPIVDYLGIEMSTSQLVHDYHIPTELLFPYYCNEES